MPNTLIETTLIDAEWIEVAYPVPLFHQNAEGQPVKVDEITLEDLRTFCKNFNETEGDKHVIFTMGHPELGGVVSIGDVLAFEVREHNGRSGLWAKPRFKDKTSLPEDTFASISYERKTVDPITGKPRPFWINAVGLTDTPVIRGLKKIKEIKCPTLGPVALSATTYLIEEHLTSHLSANSVEIEGKKMKELCLELGIPEDSTTEAIVAAIKALKDAKAETPSGPTEAELVKTIATASGVTATTTDELKAAIAELKSSGTKQMALSQQAMRKSLILAAGEDESDYATVLDLETIEFELSRGKSLFDPVALFKKSLPSGRSFRTPREDGDADSAAAESKANTDAVIAQFRK